jgi:putative Mg2+ transporter-C (MgtC) family protein
MVLLVEALNKVDRFDVESQLLLVLQCGVAALCGAIVGFDREISGKRAGVRTHMLVAVASALAVGLGDMLVDAGDGDASRVLHGVVTGVGFIGAGAIVHSKKGGPSGLTTAATIFLVAVLGAASAAGAPVLALSVTALAIATLRGVKGLEMWLRARQTRRGADTVDAAWDED